MICRAVSSVLVVCTLSLLGAAGAAAEGGTTIAGAPVAAMGQQEFGNTANGGAGEPGCFSSDGHTYRSWWLVPVTAGDALTIDWETQSTSMVMNLFPVGTTDYTFPNVEPLVQENVNSNYKAEGIYTATQTGNLPLELFSDSGCGNDPAPYDFTASVRHAVVLSLTTPNPLPRTGTLTVGVHNPDGGDIGDSGLSVALQVQTGEDAWASIGSGVPASGQATIAYTLPSTQRGTATLRATSSGAAYLDGSSAGQTVQIARTVDVAGCAAARARQASARATYLRALARARHAQGRRRASLMRSAARARAVWQRARATTRSACAPA